MADEVHISITEIVTLTGKSKGFKLNVDGRDVTIPVDEAVFAHYMNQFYRETPTAPQKQRFSTLLNLMRAAYKKGFAEGKKAK